MTTHSTTCEGFSCAQPARQVQTHWSVKVLHSALRALVWPFKVMEARATMRQLAGMNDHELRDIGLSRADVRDATGLALDQDPGVMLGGRAVERAMLRAEVTRIGR